MTLSERQINLLQAYDEAQRIAFAPFVFQACAAAKKTGLLNLLGQSEKPLSIAETASRLALSEYAVGVLADILVSSHVLEEHENRTFSLSKVGECLIYDKMTEVNFDFSDSVNYRGLSHAQEALETGKPAGLKEFAPDWETIYPHLKDLPDEARKAWFAFDHYHSDSAYQAALDILKNENIRYFADIGGNTGRFTAKALKTWGSARACIVDLPEQIAMMRANAEIADFQPRIDAAPVNWLDCGAMPAIPSKVDLIWMSQFLDCFSHNEAVSILKRVKSIARGDNARIAILEPITDHQRNSAATLSVACSSLYFSCLANGNSKFFASDELKAIIDEAELEIEEVHEPLGVGHSLYLCR